MVRLGVNTWCWVPEFTAKQVNLIFRAKDIGFDGIEIPILRSFMNKIDVQKTKEALESAGIGCVNVLAYGFREDPSSPNKSVRKNAVNIAKRAIEIANTLGSDVVAGPHYAAVGKLTGKPRTKAEWNMVVRFLKQLGPYAQDHGVTLAVEPLNRFETYFLNTAADAVNLVKEVDHPSVKVHLDTFHMNIEEKDVYAALKETGDLLFHFHANENDRGTPGTGQVHWKDVARAVKDSGYDRWAVIESFVLGPKEIKTGAAMWRETASSRDELVTEGFRFLKKLFSEA